MINRMSFVTLTEIGNIFFMWHISLGKDQDFGSNDLKEIADQLDYLMSLWQMKAVRT